jgi:hypothetical protein
MENVLLAAVAGIIGAGILIGSASAAYMYSTRAAVNFRVLLSIHPPCHRHPGAPIDPGAADLNRGSKEDGCAAIRITCSPGVAVDIGPQPAGSPAGGECTGAGQRETGAPGTARIGHTRAEDKRRPPGPSPDTVRVNLYC